jgi:hypothetical protein
LTTLLLHVVLFVDVEPGSGEFWLIDTAHISSLLKCFLYCDLEVAQTYHHYT